MTAGKRLARLFANGTTQPVGGCLEKGQVTLGELPLAEGKW